MGLILTPARIEGPTGTAFVRLALDTGATTTLIRTAVLVSIGYDPTAAPEWIQMTTGSGVETAPRLRINRIVAIGCERAEFAVIAHTLPPSASVDGVLGLDFLREKRLVVDFVAGRVTLD